MFEYVLNLAPIAAFDLYMLWRHPSYRVISAKVALIAVVVGLLFDYSAEFVWNRIWIFDPEKTLPFWVLGLPFEEWMYCVVVGVFASTVTLSLNDRKRNTLRVDDGVRNK